MPKRFSITAANAAWMAYCLPAYQAFDKAVKNPQDAQERILKRLIRANTESAFGRKFQFSRLRNVRDFQQAVPVSSYEDLSLWIRRITEGEQQVLTAEPVLMFERTSGSSDSAKYIPYTQSLRAEFQRAVAFWMCDLYVHHPRLVTGKAYWSLTTLARSHEVTKGGIPVGFESDTEYFGRVQRKLLQTIMAVPDGLAQVENLDTAIYATLRLLMQAPSLAFISVWHPSFLTILMNHLQIHAERLIDDLRDGKLRPPCATQHAGLGLLEQYLRSDSVLAKRLTSIHRHSGRIPAHELWPNLELISCWTDAAARSGVPPLEKAFPGTTIQGKGLLATEGIVSVPVCGRKGCATAITSHFYEFLEDGATETKLAHELELGHEYVVLLTTGGGLWRYKLGDCVRVVDFYARTPMLEFIGRNDEISDLCGEKLNSIFVGRVLESLVAEGAYFADFAMLAPFLEETPRYVLFLQGHAHDSRLANLVDEKLRANPHYNYCRSLGQLAAPAVFQITENAAESFVRRSVALGIRAGSVKPSALHRIPGWEHHFPGQFVGQETRATMVSAVR